MEIYEIKSHKAGQHPTVLGSFESLADARKAMVEALENTSISMDDALCLNEEQRAAEIEFVRQLEEDGVDASEIIAKIEAWSLPCIYNQETHEMVTSTADGYYAYDGEKVYIDSTPLGDRIKEHLESMCPDDEDPEIVVEKAETIDDNTCFVSFEFNGYETNKAVYYIPDDMLFTPDDWQGAEPETVEEIGKFRWLNSAGDEAIVLNGLPRVFLSIRDDARKEYGKWVKTMRREQGMTAEELAFKSGLIRQNITRIESGRYNVTLDTMTRISAALGVKYDEC